MEVAGDVQRLRVGDRVALEPGVPCWANPVSRCAALCWLSLLDHHCGVLNLASEQCSL